MLYKSKSVCTPMHRCTRFACCVAFTLFVKQQTILKPRFPQKLQFGTTASILHSVQYILALPPVRWSFELHCACVLRAGRIQGTSQTNPCYMSDQWPRPLLLSSSREYYNC